MRFSKTANAYLSKTAVVLLGAVAAAPLAGAPLAHAREVREVIDALGTRVALSDHPSRIVTLAPSLGELAADLAGEEMQKIIGVSEYTDYPPALKSKAVTSVGPYTHFNIEQILALKPDLVLATTDGNARDQIEHLRELHLPVIVVNTGTLDEVAGSMRLVGAALGSPEAGETMAAQFKKGIEDFKVRAQGRKAARVLLELGDDPFIVVGKGSFLNEGLSAIGAVNLYADSGSHYPRPAFEDAIARNPDVVLLLSLGGSSSLDQGYAKRWAPFHSVPAVRDGKVAVISSESLFRPTLRFLEGLSILEKAVYGEHK